MIIRKGQIEDMSEMQLMFVDTITSVCSADYDIQQIKVWTSSIENVQRWNDILTEQFVLIAQEEGRIVGFATLRDGNYLDLLYVHKDYQRQGIAHKLYYEIENEAMSSGQTELTSDVSITAKPFFEKAGFQVINQQTVIRQGVEFTNFKMMKELM